MVETDYPHGDGTWPDTQLVIEKLLGPHPRRRAADDVQRERGQALPPPAARRRAPRSSSSAPAARPVCEASRRMTTTADAPEAPGQPDAGQAVADGGVARALVRARVRAALPPAHQRLGPPGASASAILVFAIWHQDDPGDFERNLFTSLNGLPEPARLVLPAPLRARRAVGARPRGGRGARGAALAAARDLAIGGVSTWVLARLIGALVVENASLSTRSTWSPARRRHRRPSPRCASRHRRRHLGGVALPHPPGAPPRAAARPADRRRRRSTSAPRCPTACFAAVALGWAVAALVHLAFGSPGRAPDGARRCAPRSPSSGVDAHDVHLLAEQPTTGTTMTRARRRRAAAWSACSAATRPTRSSWRSSGVPRVQGRRAHAPPHPARGRRGAGLRAAARRTRRRPRSTGRRRRHRRAGRGAPRVTPARRARGSPTLDAADGHRRVLDDLWRQVGRAARRHASRTARSTPTTWSSTDARSASPTSSSPTGAAATGRRAADVAELLVSTAQLVGRRPRRRRRPRGPRRRRGHRGAPATSSPPRSATTCAPTRQHRKER